MKSLTKSIRTIFAASEAQVQLLFLVAGVLRDVRSALFGCINAGKSVLTAMMETERTALCGPEGVPDPGRMAYRGGHTKTSVVLGGQRIAIRRSQGMRCGGAGAFAADLRMGLQGHPLNEATLAAIAAGVSRRRFSR